LAVPSRTGQTRGGDSGVKARAKCGKADPQPMTELSQPAASAPQPPAELAAALRALAPARRDLLYFLSLGLFGFTLFLSIALVKFGIPGLPFRAITTMLIVLVTAALCPPLFLAALRRVAPILAIITVCAAIAIVASLANTIELGVLARQVLEIHFQACVGIIAGGCLVLTLGPRAVVLTMAAAVSLSGLVAVGQFLGLGPAWDLRDLMQRLQPLDLTEDGVFLRLRLRAMGLSFSPVHLGTQIVLAFAGLFALILATSRGRAMQGLDLRALVLVAIACAFSLASGNRSPILGVAAFLIAYAFVLKPAIAVILAILFLPFVVLIDDILELLADQGLRAARIDDGSASNRSVLRAYGTLLFLDRPYGYGLAFNSPDYWTEYWEKLKHYPNPKAISIHALHNYYFVMLNKYGAAILLVAGYTSLLIYKKKTLALCFLPYMVHIYFHNDGPLQGDFLIWYLIPSILTLQAAGQVFFEDRVQRAGRRPTRSPAAA
jgi:hypothetical protein